jgi:DNA-binding GntR family transcriptional regulator
MYPAVLVATAGAVHVQTMQNKSRGSRAEQIRLALEGEIISGRLKPGDVIDETEIASRFKVSRTPTREAILLLTHSGMVEKLPRKGAVVARIELGRLIHNFELMSELEGISARFAARRMTEEEKSALSKTHEASRKALSEGDQDEYYAQSHKFHLRIMWGTHNEALIEVVDRLGIQLVPFRRFQLRYPGRSEANFAEHAEVLSAILSGDSEKAASLFRRHATVQGDALAEYISIFNSRGSLRAKKMSEFAPTQTTSTPAESPI